MRYGILALMTLTVAIATPAWAAQKSTPTLTANARALPSFDDCFRLGWVRGVHVEQGELPAWNEACMAGKIPFDSGNPASSVLPTYK